MHITLDIPDCYEKRNLYVFAGMDVVARNQHGKGWEIKVEECSRCGKCCEKIDERHPLGSSNGCIHLNHCPGERLCKLGIFRPYGCAIADGYQVGVQTCTVRWRADE